MLIHKYLSLKLIYNQLPNTFLFSLIKSNTFSFALIYKCKDDY